jgi:hypothetical protein
MKGKQPSHVAGVHPETSGLMNVLARAGVTAPHTGKPYTEGMLLGVGGGVSFNYYVFQYQGWTPTFFLSGRYLLQDNVAFLEGACKRLGVGTTVKESSSPKVAEKNLLAGLESGSAIAWVDLASLSYSGLPAPLRRMMHYVVNVHGLDEEQSVAWVGDTLCKKPIPVPREELTQARGAITGQKYRVLSAKPAGSGKALDGKGLEKAIREGIRLCCEAAAKGKTWNTRIDGIRKWGELLTSDTKESWPRVFVPGVPMFMGLARAYVCIEHFGTGGGFMRGLYADFLEEAADVLKLKALNDVAGRYRALAKQWSRFARACLPDDVAPLKETRELIDRYVKALYDKGEGAGPDLQKLLEALRTVRKQRVEEKFPLDEAGARQMLAGLQKQLLEIADGETGAIEALGAAASR